MGILGWTPQTLYMATIPHILMAFKGWKLANCPSDPEKEAPVAEDNKAFVARMLNKKKLWGLN